MKKIKLVLIILWMSVIFLFSNQPSDESSYLSNSFINNTIIRVYEIFNGNITLEKRVYIIKKYSLPVRKFAHFSVYFILGILSYSYFKDFSKRALIYSLLLCFVYACFDEFHQYFVDGRYCSFLDVLVDSLGSITSICIFNLQRNKKSV